MEEQRIRREQWGINFATACWANWDKYQLGQMKLIRLDPRHLLASCLFILLLEFKHPSGTKSQRQLWPVSNAQT